MSSEKQKVYEVTEFCFSFAPREFAPIGIEHYSIYIMESKSIGHIIYIHGSDAVSPILNIAH